jgi:hypothetical protein
MFGAAVGYFIRVVEARRADVGARCIEMQKEVSAVQIAAQKYWSRARQNCGEQAEFIELEGEISGRLFLISVFLTKLYPAVGPAARVSLESGYVAFWEGCTDGNFKDQERTANPSRVARIYRTGGEFCGCLHDISFAALITWPERAWNSLVTLSKAAWLALFVVRRPPSRGAPGFGPTPPDDTQ